MIKGYFIMCVFVGLFLSIPREAASQKSITMKEVVVVAKKRVEEQAVTKTVVDSVYLAQSASGTLSELLTKATPVFIKSYGQGSAATISFRGTGASHTQVEWNGININNPMLGQVDFSQIPVWFVDNVELYHGGSSLQKGSGALGGAISISTRPRWGEKYYGGVVQGVGGFGKFQSVASIGGGTDKFQSRFRYLYERAENNFEYINTAIPPFELTRQTNAQYNKHAVAGDLNWSLGKRNFLSLNLWFHTSERNMPTIMSYEGLGRKERDQSDEFRMVAKWAKYWNNDVIGEFSSGYSRTDMDYILSNNTYLQWVVNTSSRSYTNSIFNKYKVDWNISDRSVLKTSINLDYHDVSTLNKLTQEGYATDRLAAGATVSFHHSFNKYISGYLLVHEELTDGVFSPIMPSIGISSSPLSDDRLNIAVNATRNYHMPTLNDLYWQPGGNPKLRPEEGYSGDLTIGYNDTFGGVSFRASASGYLSMINDWIIWQPSEFMYWTAQNIQKVYSRGAEASFSLGYSIGTVDFKVNANYAFTKTTNESADESSGDFSRGKQLIYIPLHKANVLFGAEYKRFYLDFSWSFTDERYTTTSNEATRHKLPYYSVCDITVGKKIYLGKRDKTAFDVQFKVNNLFNINYQAILWRAMPGRNFYFQIKFDF